jgi:hypothetical protein
LPLRANARFAHRLFLTKPPGSDRVI